MAAGRIVLPPYMPTRNRDGLLVDQARLTVYENETTVKATIYSDDGLTTPQANPVIANSSGQFPPIWAEAGTTESPILYSLAIADASGASVGNPGVFDNWQPSVDGETAASVLAESAADSAAASAIDAAASATVAEDALDEILAAAAAAPETLPLLNKANLNGGNVASTGNAANFRQNIGAVGSAALAAGTGLTLTGFQNVGSGAQVRTGDSKLKEIPVSVLDYYQSEDGSDYGPAFGRALNAAANVFWPNDGVSRSITSAQTVTLNGNKSIDWNGAPVTFSGSGLLSLKSPLVVGSGRTLAANAARWATSIVLNSSASIQTGDILNIQSSDLPSPTWPDYKQDTVRVRSVSGANVTLEDGLNFSWDTGDTGLNVTVWRPVSVQHVNPNITLNETDGTNVTRQCVYHEAVVDWSITGGSVKGPRPFTRDINVYRQPFVFYYSLGGVVRNLSSEAISYPILLAGASRYLQESGTNGRYNRHTCADMGGWSSDYIVDGLDDQDSYSALSTHAAFRCTVRNANVRNNSVLMPWRPCGGGITDSYIHTTDSTSNTPQFQSTQPASGYEYIYTDRGDDFTLRGTVFDNPNRTVADVFVQYGNRVVVDGISAFDVRVGSPVVDPVINRNLKLSSGRVSPTKGLIESADTKVPAPDVLDAYLDSGTYHIDPYQQLATQAGRTARFKGQVFRMIDGGAIPLRLHYNAFPGSASLTSSGVLTLRLTLNHGSGPTSGSAFSIIERKFFVTLGLGPNEALLTEIGSGTAVTPSGGTSDVTLSVGSVSITSGTDGYVSFTATIGQSGGASAPKYSMEYECVLTQNSSL